MPFEFKLPDLGEGIHEAQVLTWRVKAGQTVAAFDPLCEVESAKAAVELTAPVAGRVLETRFEEGDTAHLGEVLVVIDTGAAEQPEPEWFGIVGSAPITKQPKPTGRVRAAPFVRRLARERGIDLESVVGSGPQGRVRLADLETAAHHDPSPQPSPPGGRGSFADERTSFSASTPGGRGSALERLTGSRGLPLKPLSARGEAAEPERGGEGSLAVIPLKGMRKSIADHMVAAWRNAPQVTSMDLLDVTQLVEARSALLAAAEAEGVRLTYLPFFVKAAVEGLRAVPEANAVVDEQQQAIVIKPEFHIGIATAVPGGLVVPVIRSADRLSVLEIAGEIERLVSAARERRASPADLSGSTFTITSFGSLPGSPLFGTPILNYPEVAILGLGRIDLQPRVVDGQVMPRQCIGVSFTFDHRVLDGEGAGRFMAAFKRVVEQPLELLLRLR